MSVLTSEEHKFLASLRSDGDVTESMRIPYATPEQEKVRAKAKKKKWAEFSRKPWGWKILEEGQKVLIESTRDRNNKE